MYQINLAQQSSGTDRNASESTAVLGLLFCCLEKFHLLNRIKVCGQMYKVKYICIYTCVYKFSYLSDSEILTSLFVRIKNRLVYSLSGPGLQTGSFRVDYQ